MQKNFENIQHPFVTKDNKTFKLDIKGTYLNIIGAIYDQPTVNIIFNYERMKLIFPLSSGRR